MKKRKVRVGASWRLEETYIKVKGIWCYLYREVDTLGNIVDCLVTRKRQRMIEQSFLIKAINNNYRPRVININKVVLILPLSKSITNVLSQRLKFDSVNVSTILSNRTIVLSSGAYKTD
ncbi:DDE-type integrase/transposase/recombinase [Flavobacterium piscis]|uniref:DDE-type integrase/transposase/recombinase n=1 Tax=Flavobacterium piscis TaxID=1114874 RepID=UPI0009F42566